MRIFISYARVDKPFCAEFVHTLSAYDVWYDLRLYAGEDWWQEILRRLEWCDVFIYLISKDSLASTYCRKELKIARRLKRGIIPVLIDGDVDVPKELGTLQYIDMSECLDANNVSILHNSIYRLQQRIARTGKKQLNHKLQTDEVKLPETSSTKMISLAFKAFQDGKYDRTILLLEQAKAKDLVSHFINVDVILETAKEAIEIEERRKNATREYKQIVELFKYPRMRKFGCDALAKFHKVYPEHDPENLKSRCGSKPQVRNKESTITESEILPMLKWVKISGGIVRLTSNQSHQDHMGERTIRLKDYLISKYPVTNQQFDTFVRTKGGYYNPKWWRFSDYAIDWFEKHPTALEPRYKGNDRPREMVTWYEAMAFTRWLSHKTGLNITLPRIAQWQYAAQGDDERFYPWGNVFHQDYCNTNESQIKSTTSVNHYEKGVSPFGVYDMAGNVWEWCLDKKDPEDGSFDFQRCVLGGSHVSPADRAQISFRYYFNPEVRYSSIGFRLVCLPNTSDED